MSRQAYQILQITVIAALMDIFVFAITLRTNRAVVQLSKDLTTLVQNVEASKPMVWKLNSPKDRFATVAGKIGTPQVLNRHCRLN